MKGVREDDFNYPLLEPLRRPNLGTHDQTIKVSLWNDVSELDTTCGKEAAFHRPLAVSGDGILWNAISQGMCNVTSDEPWLAIDLDDATGVLRSAKGGNPFHTLLEPLRRPNLGTHDQTVEAALADYADVLRATKGGNPFYPLLEPLRRRELGTHGPQVCPSA